MISWNGAVWVGKDDGLYQITSPVGYPVTGTLTCNKIIDLLPVADVHNFSMLVIHQGDLWFTVGSGVMRYTTGGVLTALAPDTGLTVSTSKRNTSSSMVLPHAPSLQALDSK